MPIEIEGNPKSSGEFHPLVGIRTKPGEFVKGKLLAVGETVNGNPVVTLEIIDLDGVTTQSVSKGVYAEVEVKVGDKVQLVATVLDLKDKLPKLAPYIGKVVTITFEKTTKVSKGTKKCYKVTVD